MMGSPTYGIGAYLSTRIGAASFGNCWLDASSSPKVITGTSRPR